MSLHGIRVQYALNPTFILLFSHTSPFIQYWYSHRLIASPELSLVIDVLFDFVDGVFKEPILMLKLSNLLLDHLVRRILLQLLVADV